MRKHHVVWQYVVRNMFGILILAFKLTKLINKIFYYDYPAYANFTDSFSHNVRFLIH